MTSKGHCGSCDSCPAIKTENIVEIHGLKQGKSRKDAVVLGQ